MLSLQIENGVEWLPKTGQKQVEQQCRERMLASEFKVHQREQVMMFCCREVVMIVNINVVCISKCERKRFQLILSL